MQIRYATIYGMLYRDMETSMSVCVSLAPEQCQCEIASACVCFGSNIHMYAHIHIAASVVASRPTPPEAIPWNPPPGGRLGGRPGGRPGGQPARRSSAEKTNLASHGYPRPSLTAAADAPEVASNICDY